MINKEQIVQEVENMLDYESQQGCDGVCQDDVVNCPFFVVDRMENGKVVESHCTQPSLAERIVEKVLALNKNLGSVNK